VIAIIDYGMGNLRSVEKALERVGAQVQITSDPQRIEEAERIVLPGVGAFRDAKDGLEQRGLVAPLLSNVKKGKPFLGICLGLQLLFERSFEDGEHEGLSLLAGEVVRFDSIEQADGQKLKIPHMGWNNILPQRDVPLLEGVPVGTYMYFVHSYYVAPKEESVIATETVYGRRFVSMVWRDNVYATQFHPEKSQKHGLRVLENFVRL